MNTDTALWNCLRKAKGSERRLLLKALEENNEFAALFEGRGETESVVRDVALFAMERINVRDSFVDALME